MRVALKILMMAVACIPIASVHAQHNEIDSLKSILKRYSSVAVYDAKAVDAMNELSRHLRRVDIACASKYADQALSVSKQLNYIEGETIALQRVAVVYAMKGKLDESIELLKVSNALAEKHHYQVYLGQGYNNLGLVYLRLGKYSKAKDMLLKSLAVKGSDADPYEVAITQNNLGIVYKRLGMYDEAMDVYMRSGNILELTEHKDLLADIRSNMGNIAARFRNYQKAIDYNKQALKLYKELGLTYDIMRCYTNIGQFYIKLEDDEESKINVLEAVRYGKMVDTDLAKLYVYQNYGRYYSVIGEYDSAIVNYERSYDIACNVKDIENMLLGAMAIAEIELRTGNAERARTIVDSISAKATSINGQIYLQEMAVLETISNYMLGDYERGGNVFRKYLAIIDSLNTKRRESNVDELEVAFNLKMKEQENRYLQKQKELDKIELLRKADMLTLMQRNKLVQDLELQRKQDIIRLQDSKAHQVKNEMAALEKQRKIQELNLEREESNTRLALGGSIVLGVIVLLFVYLYRQKKISAELQRRKSEELESASEELRHNQKELEHKSDELTSAMNELQKRNEMLEKLNIDKSEFLAIAAHDLRNPISTIYGLADLIRTSEQEDPEVIESATHIRTSAERILALVANLLEANILESGEKRLLCAPVDIHDLINVTVQSNSVNARQKGIQISTDMSRLQADAVVDRGAMMQILDNLISNAVKFSPRHTRVYVNAYSNAHWVKVEIVDQGPGIKSEDREFLFRKFSRLSTRPTAGEISSGLGLYIVHKLVTSMSGTIVCESKEGKGATFVVSVPASQVEETAQITEEMPTKISHAV